MTRRRPLYAFTAVAVWCAASLVAGLVPGDLFSTPRPIADLTSSHGPSTVVVEVAAVPDAVELPPELTSLPLGQRTAVVADGLVRGGAGVTSARPTTSTPEPGATGEPPLARSTRPVAAIATGPRQARRAVEGSDAGPG